LARSRANIDGKVEQREFRSNGDRGGAMTFARLCDALSIAPGSGWPDEFGRRLRRWSEKAVSRRLRTISLFSGAGGLDIGFHDAGFDILEMVEWHSKYAKTLEENAKPGGYFGAGEVRSIDIREYVPSRALRRSGIDLVIGGPPCQSFSAAGRRAAGVEGTNEARGTLFQEYVRVLREVHARAFVFENVYGITGAQGGRAWTEITTAFAAAGYMLFHRVLDSADYGVPQHRERMIIVGIKNGDFRFPRPTHGPDSDGGPPHCTAGEALRGVPQTKAEVVPDINGRFAGLLEEVPPGLNYSFFTENMGHPRPMFAWRSKFSDFLYKGDPTRPVRTVKAFCGQYTGPFHWDNRRFRLPEFKRLQTFPDHYAIVGSRSIVLQQIGNSVPPQMARILALAVLDQVFGMAPPAPLPTLNEQEKLGFRTRKRSLASEYKKKAEKAIRELGEGKSTVGKGPRRRAFTCHVDEKFQFEKARRGLPWHVVIQKRARRLSVSVRGGDSPGDAGFAISMRPARLAGWVLDIEDVRIEGTALERDCFLCGWKALEWWIRTSGFKDDLVQLNGYFAYEPSVKCSMTVEGRRPTREWQAVTEIVEGVGVRSMLSGGTLAAKLGMRKSELRGLLLRLRELGYEVRSHLTNPQIPADNYLIPYAFPTLNHRSVQLHKQLF
jgi:DNA (cytosine-5)-methyltransferase 1